MTVSVLRNKAQYTGNGSSTQFEVTFAYTETSQIKVYLDGSLQTLTTHYTITDPGQTGTVTFVTAPESGVVISLIRETDYLQTVDYANNDILDAETLESAFDKLTMMCQQLKSLIDGSVGFDETVSDAETTSLKLAAGITDLAGKLLAFDATGNFVTTQEIGTWKGNYSASTAYVVRDIVKDPSTDNVYFTKLDAPAGTSLSNTTYFALLVDVETVRTLKEAAELAETNAETAQAAAEAALASFQGQYKVGATNPYSGTPDAGDLWYDTTNSILKYYVSGTGFEPVTTSLGTVTDNYLTISNQVITAGTVPISLGGTGSTTASGARTALGLAIGTDVQAYDADTTKNNVSNTFSVNQIISVADNTNAALRITQTGTGNALVVEDSSPDGSPFVVTNIGKVGIGISEPSEELEIESATPAIKLSDTDESGSFGTVSMASSAIYLQANGASSDGVLIYRSGNAGTFTERMRIDSSGNVGIGTTSPNSKLNVATNSTDAAVTITQTGTGNALVVEDSTNPDSTPFVVDASGNVGIGTTSPTNFPGYATLEVTNTSNGGAILVRGSSVEGRLVGDDVSGTFQLRAQSTHPISFLTSANERMRIDSSGNVGIGTTSPSQKLDVSGNINATGALTLGTALAITEGGTGATDAATARTNLGLGTLSTQSTITESQISDLQSYLTAETNDLGSAVTGTLPIANGGTGQTTAAAARIALLPTLGTAGQVLAVNTGTTDVEWVDAASGGGSGTVTSVAISGSDGIEVDSGSPITTSGTIALGINAATLSSHLSLGTAATTASTDYATAAQGTLAASAVQPGDDAADLGSGAATDGYVLTADGAGNAAWEAASGGGGGTVPGRNLIINGDFRVNQRGAASRTASMNAYNYDRWYYDGAYLYQVIEDLNIVNGDYTISWSGSGLTAAWLISSNTTSSIPTAFTAVTNGSSFTVSGKTTGDHLWIRFGEALGTLAGLADVQVEAGTVATPFERRLIGTELALCQRYFQKYSGTGLVFYGYWDATNAAVLGFNYPVTPRIPPTGIIVSSASHFFINNSAVGNPTTNSIAFGSSSASTLDLSATVASGGSSSGKSCKMISNNASAFIEITGVEL